jgi:hypothetical protein
MRRLVALLLVGITLHATAQTHGDHGLPGLNKNFEEPEAWKERLDVEPPTFPRPADLVEFYVGPVTTNQYFIDASTLSVGTDSVVRYVLVVKTSGGATNMSFEGINCKERSWKHYASGNNDKATWTKSRAARIEWRLIENKTVNRHHAALNRDYFCPAGNPIQSADEGRNALRLGKHPGAN